MSAARRRLEEVEWEEESERREMINSRGRRMDLVIAIDEDFEDTVASILLRDDGACCMG